MPTDTSAFASARVFDRRPMPRELERAVVELVRGLLHARLDITPAWLVRPGKAECGPHWPVIEHIYAELTEGLVLPEVMRAVERRQVDAVLVPRGLAARILEVDEAQHFNTYRARTLELYPHHAALAFPVDVWIERSRNKAKLEGGGFGRPKPPLFPGDGGRHPQRAFRDALCDLLPPEHGFLPTLRIADFEVRNWLSAPDARVRMARLLNERL